MNEPSTGGALSPTDWEYLAESLEEMGLRPGHSQPPAYRLHEHLAEANGIPAGEALEWLAGAFHMVPVAPARAHCSSRAEMAFRRFAVAGDNHGWMPFGTLGPLLICAHFNPSSGGMWGIPTEFVIPVIIPQASYEELRDSVLEKIAVRPLERATPHTFSRLPPTGGNLDQLLDWLIEEYPLDKPESRQRIAAEREQLLADGGPDALRRLSRGLGLALHFLSTREACFNPEHAPSQSIFPDALLEKHAVYPLYCGRRVVYLLSENKHDYAFEDEWLSGGHEAFTFRMVQADRPAILRVISRERGRVAQSSSASPEAGLVDAGNENAIEIDPAQAERINPSSMDVTPEQVMHWVLHRAVAAGASDLHIEKFYNMARFRSRIDGGLRTLHACPEDQLPRFVSLIKNWSNMGQRRHSIEDGRFSMHIGQRRIDGRVSAIPCRKQQQKITIRFLDKQGGIKKLDALSLTADQLATLRGAMARDQGLILITGPTGSGKTTTLYALLDSVNGEALNIHTVEDPIEYEIEGINQTQTDPANGVTFADGLRGLMRADPDVILIGECRDEETATAAVTAALTGHLVLTTLHANDSLRAVSRFLSMGIPPYLLADALALSQAQRLVRRLCQVCRKPVVPGRHERAIFEANRVPVAADHIFEPQGCQDCGDTGYRGRIALMELCPVNSELSALIAAGAPQDRLRECALKSGFQTLYQQGLSHVLEGQTSLEEVACLAYTSLVEDPAGIDPGPAI